VLEAAVKLTISGRAWRWKASASTARMASVM
jgi:hypothetical protein